jgi:hypothetical protein
MGTPFADIVFNRSSLRTGNGSDTETSSDLYSPTAATRKIVGQIAAGTCPVDIQPHD